MTNHFSLEFVDKGTSIVGWLHLSKSKRIICLIGMDGTGKTTHAIGIIDYLRKHGYKYRYVWFGSPYFFSFPFMVICRLLGFTKTHHLANGFVFSEHLYFKNKSLSWIWPWVQFIDLMFFVGLRVYWPLKAGFTVVCDRFTPDNLVELMVDIRDEKLHKRLVGQLLLKMKPEGCNIFLLDVNESFAFQRKQDLPNLDYLVQRRRKYRSIASELRIPIINAERSFWVVNNEIIGNINLDA